LAKKDDLHSRRMIIRKLPKKDIVKTLYDEIAPLYVDRPGGYTRIVKLGYRDNDRAPVSIIEFVDMVDVSTSEEKETDAS
jgi:large subunit ribosomal protein L17